MTGKPGFRKRYYPLYWLLLGISWLPLPALYLLSDFLGLILYRLLGYRKKVVRQNLLNAFPEKSVTEIEKLIPAFYQNLCDIIVETIKLATVSEKALKRRVTLLGRENVLPFLESGKPIILMGSHLGNWEWALTGGGLRAEYPMDAVYKPLTNEFFEWFMKKLRTRFGGHVIPMKDTLRDMVRRQNIPRLINLLSDQTPPRSEIQYWTTFLHQDTGFFVGAEKLARSFKHPVGFVGARRPKRGYYEFTLEMLYDQQTPLPENAPYPITEMYVRKLEEWIRKYPADYLWSHRRWKHKKPLTEAAPVSAK